MTEFRNAEGLLEGTGACASFFCEGKSLNHSGFYEAHRFRIGGFVPAVTNGFAPPADNIHSHNDPGKPGYDARCVDAPPVPARFSVICSCGRGYYLEAREGDLRINPAMILAQLGEGIELAVKKMCVDPALASRLGHIVRAAARDELARSGLVALLAEIPARGASEAEKNFCGRFIPL